MTNLSRQFIIRDHHDRTPLHMAAVNGSERCVEYILQAHPESLNALDKHQVQCNETDYRYYWLVASEKRIPNGVSRSASLCFWRFWAAPTPLSFFSLGLSLRRELVSILNFSNSWSWSCSQITSLLPLPVWRTCGSIKVFWETAHLPLP